MTRSTLRRALERGLVIETGTNITKDSCQFRVLSAFLHFYSGKKIAHNEQTHVNNVSKFPETGTNDL